MTKPRPAPERKKTVVIPDWNDDCLTCGVCDVSTVCSQCGKPLCDECASKTKRCGLCESYDLPKNFTVLPETASGMRSFVQIMLNSHALVDIPEPHVFWYDDPKLRRVATIKCRVWAGIGVHYHTDIEEDSNPIWCSEENAWVTVRDHYKERESWSMMTCRPKTVEEASRWVRRELIKRYKKKPTYVVFKSSEVRKWFYKDGD